MNKNTVNVFEKTFIKTIKNKQINFISMSDKEIVEQLYLSIENNKFFSRTKNNPPDYIFETTDAIYAVEHFMIDCTKKTSKGSKLIQNRII